MQRRHPALELVLAPCRVQGEGAGAEIAAAIRALNRYHAAACATRGPRAGLDLILVTRGGGSLEDLWAFNEEVVARAIVESALPVVSAVGHEIDFTISDFVADCRAATPSAAAELITAGVVTAREWLVTVGTRLPRLARERHADRAEELAAWLARLRRAHPRQRVNEAWQRLDDLRATLARTARFAVRDARARWEAAAAAWRRVHPRARLEARRRELATVAARLEELGRRHFERDRQCLETLRERLRLLSPEQTLARGYSITTDAASGRIIRDAAQTRPGQEVTTRVQRGVFRSRVE
jgi:exodeoxyribonuclease VII large subunit